MAGRPESPRERGRLGRALSRGARLLSGWTTYALLVTAICIASGVLGYYTWQTASQFEQLGTQTIGQSTLLLVSEKVDVIEQYIIGSDNAVFDMVESVPEEMLEGTFLSGAEEKTPSVEALLILDSAGHVERLIHRGTPRQRTEFEKVFTERIRSDMELSRQPLRELKHLHRSYAGNDFLISYKAIEHERRRYYLVAYHNTEYIVENEFTSLFATEEGKRLYNVVDANNRRVYGPNLARAGDYVFGRRFPTTLYEWRLQVAPKQAPLLESQNRSRRLTEVSLLATSFLVILLGIAFLLYAAAKERRLNALRSEFIANVSHELKTPLSVIRMFGEMLATRRVKNEEKQAEYLDLICRESERLSALIENVLDFAALERGKRRYELVGGDLGEVIRESIETFRYRVEREGAEVSMEVDDDLPEVPLDRQAIMLATINLLDNAVKYGGKERVDVRVRRDGEYLSVSIRDRGRGIPEEDLRRIFERFYRSKREDQIRGSGIGLSLVQHIAEAHGGKAWAENAPEGGAVVSFSVAC